VVYRAVAADSGRVVAVKLVPPDKFPSAAARKKFLEDARAAQRLSHPHLRQVHEAGESSDRVYLVMEYLEGATLKSLLVSGRMEPEIALEWAAEVADALAALHAAGLVHGDLRPSRVFVTSQGTVKLLEAALWRLGVPAGTDLTRDPKLDPARAAALAPEQLRGREPSPQSDIHGLGVLLFEMVTGRPPFLGRNVQQTVHWVLNRAPDPVGPPAGLDTVLARALAKDPKARYRSAAEFAAALRAVAAGEEVPAEAAPAAAPAVTLRWTASLWWGIGVIIALAAAWFAYLALTRP
jgi:serine/threonine-protein kinase